MLSSRAVGSLLRAMVHPVALLGRAIGPQLREQIILHVSSYNQCAVCSVVHGLVARAEGLGPDAIRAARAPVGDDRAADRRTKLAFQYAEIRTAGMESQFPEVLERFERAFSPAEQREVRAIVDLFTFNNRFNNTWEAWLPGSRSRRKTLGLHR